MPYQYVVAARRRRGEGYICLRGIGMGRTNERIGRIQESYVANATTSWLESLERSLAQMKEYQVRGSYGNRSNQ